MRGAGFGCYKRSQSRLLVDIGVKGVIMVIFDTLSCLFQKVELKIPSETELDKRIPILIPKSCLNISNW